MARDCKPETACWLRWRGGGGGARSNRCGAAWRGGGGQAGTRAKWEKLPVLVQQTAQAAAVAAHAVHRCGAAHMAAAAGRQAL